LNRILIEVLDGKNCIGGSKILITEKERSFFLDFGKNFKTWGNYFEEYLQPRTSVGLYDLWKLNLIPKISNIYRDDLIVSDFKEFVEKERKLNLKAVFLSHAHLDHAGFISILKDDIEIVASSITKKILKALQDTGDGRVFNQFIDLKIREEEIDEHGQKKLKQKKDKESIKRNFFEINRNEFEGEIDGLKFKTFYVDHSIPGALAFYFEFENISIAYTGDIRFHGKNSEGSYNFLEKIKKLKPNILITEGTRMSYESESKKESDVYKSSFEVINNNKDKLVIADFGPRNIERLETFLKIVKETGRKIVINIKDAYLLDLLKEDGFNIIDDDNLFIICEKKSKEKKCLNEVKNKYDEKLITIEDINKNLGEFILCYSFWDLTNLLDIDLKDGIYIYSSSEAYSEEQEFDIKRLFNWLHYFNLEPFGIELTNDKPKFSGDFHSSGHASYKDIKFMIDEINPEFIIPVHTEKSEIFKNLYGNKVIEKEYFEL